MNKLIFLFLALLPVYLFSQTYTGTVIRIIDGDTFVFQTEEGSLKVRSSGIDAPEKDQPHGLESKAFMEGFLNKPATIESSGVDQYGRTLAILFVENKNINLESVRLGNAWHYKKYSKDEQLSEAEIYARENHLGLWSKANPIPPWEYRKMNK